MNFQFATNLHLITWGENGNFLHGCVIWVLIINVIIEMKNIFESLIGKDMNIENIKVAKSNMDDSIRNSYTIFEKEENKYAFLKKNTRIEVIYLLLSVLVFIVYKKY